MGKYDDFVAKTFRRRYLDAEALLNDAKIAQSRRKEKPYPRAKPAPDIYSLPVA